jgi:hypothetical protein
MYSDLPFIVLSLEVRGKYMQTRFILDGGELNSTEERICRVKLKSSIAATI